MFVQNLAKREEISLYRALMVALLFSIVVHGLGLLTMATMLRPGVADNFTSLEQAQYIAGNVATWRIGWLPWNLSALANLAFGIILVAWAGKQPGQRAVLMAEFALLFTVVAVIPDQYGEFLMDTELVDLARGAAAFPVGEENLLLESFVTRKQEILTMLGFKANNYYVVMSLFWLFTVLSASKESRVRDAFIGVTTVACVLFIGVSAASLERSAGPTEGLLGQFWVMMLLNGMAFPLLLVQMALLGMVIGEVHAGRHPADDWHLHEFRSPRRAWFSVLDFCINSRGLRDLLRPMAIVAPMPTLKSDIENVVYLNWMVPVERVEAMLPSPLKLDVRNGKTAVSLLTYQHGHFGPALFGPLRSWLPSPYQSNWRFYIEPENQDATRDAIYFFKTSISEWPHALGSRLMSDGLPSHLTESFTHVREGAVVTSEMKSGQGSAPDLYSCVTCGGEKELPGDFESEFGTWESAVQFLVEQNRGVSVLAGMGEVYESLIDIPIAVSEVESAKCEEYRSDWLKDVTKDCEVFAFVVPALSFRALGERSVDAEVGKGEVR
jgi:hypothetical protein